MGGGHLQPPVTGWKWVKMEGWLEPEVQAQKMSFIRQIVSVKEKWMHQL